MTTFLFARTRSTIKYFSKYVTIANLMFLMYINSHMYAAQLEAFLLLVFTTILLLCFFLRKFEAKAIQVWNPYGSFTPSETNPRCAYINILSSPEYTCGFDIFSMFLPLRFQQHFPRESQELMEEFSADGFEFGINFMPNRRIPRNQVSPVQQQQLRQPAEPEEPPMPEPEEEEAKEPE